MPVVQNRDSRSEPEIHSDGGWWILLWNPVDSRPLHASFEPQDGRDSKSTDVHSADEKKIGFKDLIRPLQNSLRRSAQDPKGSLDRDSKTRVSNLRDQTEVRNCSSH